ncbi:MAG: Eco57I restriction-modification methylase domain-containing protein, partial [bacterium]
LTERVAMLHVHRYDPKTVQFSDALVTSAVVVLEKTPPSAKHNVRFSYGGSLLAPAEERLIRLGDIRGGQRWNGMSLLKVGHARPEHVTTLSDLFSIKRGIATGFNDFFIVTRKTAKERELPVEFLKPILPSPRLIRDSIIEADDDGYPLLDEQLVLIDCSIPEDQVKRRYPRLWEYLQQGKAQGIRERYLVGQREPWYSQEQRPPAPFLCTYMGRGANGGKPFRFFWNRSRATAHNVYLMLYPRGEFRTFLEEHAALEEVVSRFLQGIDFKDLVKHGRVYGGGLHKLEPKELGRVPAQQLLDRTGFRGRGAVQGQLALGELVHEGSPR